MPGNPLRFICIILFFLQQSYKLATIITPFCQRRNRHGSHRLRIWAQAAQIWNNIEPLILLLMFEADLVFTGNLVYRVWLEGWEWGQVQLLEMPSFQVNIAWQTSFIDLCLSITRCRLPQGSLWPWVRWLSIVWSDYEEAGTWQLFTGHILGLWGNCCHGGNICLGKPLHTYYSFPITFLLGEICTGLTCTQPRWGSYSSHCLCLEILFSLRLLANKPVGQKHWRRL